MLESDWIVCFYDPRLQFQIVQQLLMFFFFFIYLVCTQSTASSMRFEDAFFTTQGERKRQRTPNSRFQNDYVADPNPRTSSCSKTN